MEKVKRAATSTGFAIGVIYAFFLIPSISDLWKDSIILIIRQTLCIGFAVCLLFAPKEIIALGASFAPKLSEMYNVFFKSNKSIS